MSNETFDVLPPRIRDRVRRSRAVHRACRTGFALVVVSAMAVAGAEVARGVALERRDRLVSLADAALKACESRDRLHREVATLADRVRAAETVDGRLPTSVLLAAIANALPPGGRLDRVMLRDGGDRLIGEVQGGADDLATATAFAASLAATRPFAEVEFEDIPHASGETRGFTLRFAVPIDRRYTVAFEEEVNDGP